MIPAELLQTKYLFISIHQRYTFCRKAEGKSKYNVVKGVGIFYIFLRWSWKTFDPPPQQTTAHHSMNRSDFIGPLQQNREVHCTGLKLEDHILFRLLFGVIHYILKKGVPEI